MEGLSKEEISLFDAIIEVYQTKPAIALSCINDENREKFEMYLKEKHGDKSSFIAEEFRELAKLKKINTKKKIVMK